MWWHNHHKTHNDDIWMLIPRKILSMFGLQFLIRINEDTNLINGGKGSYSFLYRSYFRIVQILVMKRNFQCLNQMPWSVSHSEFLIKVHKESEAWSWHVYQNNQKSTVINCNPLTMLMLQKNSFMILSCVASRTRMNALNIWLNFLFYLVYI